MIDIGVLIALDIGVFLGYLDWKHLSLSRIEYLLGLLGLGAAILINFILAFQIAFVSAIVGGVMYMVVRWYTAGYTTATDNNLFLLAFIGFPLEAVFGMAVLTLRGMAKSYKYYPALFYFFVGFAVASLLTTLL